MPLTLLMAVCGVVLLTACEPEKRKQKPRQPAAGNNTTVIAPDVKPDTSATDMPADLKPTDAPPAETDKVETVAVPPPAPTGSLDYAIKVPGKPGFVRSPYTKDERMIDVRGLPPGTEAQDPYTGRNFLVP